MNKTCHSLVRFETRAAAIYQTLALQFAGSRDLAEYWFEMSIEDTEHAVFLEFCASEDLFVGNMPDRRVIRALSNLFSRIEQRASQPMLSVDEAFLIAGELETSELNAIYTRLVASVKGTPYILRKKIETLGVDHLQSLIRSAGKFRVSPHTLEMLIQLKDQGLRKAG